MACIDYRRAHGVNAGMQTTGRSAFPMLDHDEPKSAPAALALACDWLDAGNLAEAAKWAAIAANLGEAEKLIKTA